MRRINCFLLISLVSAASLGCVPTSAYQAPIAKFKTGVDTTATAVRPYFVEMNRIEIENRLYTKLKLDLQKKQEETGDQNKLAKKDEIKPEDVEWGTQDLTNTFSDDAIAARLKALRVVGQYAQLLNDVATSKAPEQLAAAAKSLGDNVSSLEKDFGKLTSEQSIPDIGTPLAAMVNLFGQMVIDAKRQEVLSHSILAASVHIETLIDLLQKDLQSAISLRETALENAQTVRLALYQTALDNASPQQKIDMLNDVLNEKEKLDTLKTVDAASLFDDMRNAHSALVAFVQKSKKAPADVADLAQRIDAFADHAKLVADAIQAVRNIK